MPDSLQHPPLPVGAAVDRKLLELIAGFPHENSLRVLSNALRPVQSQRSFDVALRFVRERFMAHLEQIVVNEQFWQVTSFTRAYLSPTQTIQVARRFLWDRQTAKRRWARRTLTDLGELHPDAIDTLQKGRIWRHPTGRAVQDEAGVLPIETVGALRQALKIASPRQLGWMLWASDGGSYHSFTIPKSSGEPRRIDAPKPQLRAVQRRILRSVLRRVTPHDAAHGFVNGRSTVTNAAAHVGRAVLVKFDLQNFFPTISYWRVVGLFASLGYGLGRLRLSTDDDSRAVAPVLARLCCYAEEPEAFGQACLPQGAPTSPAISNLILRGLDARLAGIAATMGGVYTRYADDLTFSFDDGANIGRLRWWVEEVCRQEGFAVNQKKFRVIRASQRQQVTGVVVNDCLRVPRKERRQFRAILHNCRKHGVASQARGRPDMAGYLRGFASYIHMVHPEEGRRLLDEVDALLAGEGA